MIIFVLLNLLCFILILSNCIWADKASWKKTTHNMIAVLTPYHPQLELTNISNDDNDDNDEDCDHCSRYNKDSDSDDSNDNNQLTDSSISTPSIVELENPENNNSISGSGSESDESIVVLDTRVCYLKQAQQIVEGLKEELEKKND
jgi:hypothetical protein